MILLMAGMVPLPRLAAISAVCFLLQPRIRIVPSFFRCVCELVHSRSRQSAEFEEAPLQTHTIVPLSWPPTTLTGPDTGHAALKNLHWRRAGRQTGNCPAGCTAGCALWLVRQRLPAGARDLNPLKAIPASSSHPVRNISGRTDRREVASALINLASRRVRRVY